MSSLGTTSRTLQKTRPQITQVPTRQGVTATATSFTWERNKLWTCDNDWYRQRKSIPTKTDPKTSISPTLRQWLPDVSPRPTSLQIAAKLNSLKCTSVPAQSPRRPSPVAHSPYPPWSGPFHSHSSSSCPTNPSDVLFYILTPFFPALLSSLTLSSLLDAMCLDLYYLSGLKWHSTSSMERPCLDPPSQEWSPVLSTSLPLTLGLCQDSRAFLCRNQVVVPAHLAPGLAGPPSVLVLSSLAWPSLHRPGLPPCPQRQRHWTYSFKGFTLNP